jgi:hypothetical protein
LSLNLVLRNHNTHNATANTPKNTDTTIRNRRNRCGGRADTSAIGVASDMAIILLQQEIATYHRKI